MFLSFFCAITPHLSVSARGEASPPTAPAKIHGVPLFFLRMAQKKERNISR